jgi:hypothetical protein
MKTNWTDLPAGKVNAGFQRIMGAFGENAGTIIDSVIADEQVASRMANLLINKGYELTASQATAREIMDKNFFGIEEVQKHFGLTLSKRQIAYMTEVPFSEKTLHECKDTHILVAYIPVSIVSVRAKTAGVKLPKNHRMFYKEDWYDKDEVGNSVSALEWHLIRKTSVPDSKPMTWTQQREMVDATNIDRIPEADVMVYTIIGHFLETGVRLFEKECVRTSTLELGGSHVVVGYFDSKGLRVKTWNDNFSHEHHGVSDGRKIEA